LDYDDITTDWILKIAFEKENVCVGQIFKFVKFFGAMLKSFSRLAFSHSWTIVKSNW
jgi:hypothetical protein